MAATGAIKKLTLKGSPFTVTSEADLGIELGGRRVTGKIETNGAPVFITDNVSGTVENVTVNLYGSDGSLALMKQIMADSADNIPTSCLIIMADGTKLTPRGGAIVRTDDGKLMSREGSFSIMIDAFKGEWLIS